jgi:anthranilate phosphoribosyltransferase
MANAAMALFATGAYKNYEECYAHSVESLESGTAYKTFQKLISLQK